MKEATPCPYCGCPQPDEGNGRGQPPSAHARAIDALCREVDRVRDIAERRETDADRRRVEELAREVHQLRETVARLRGASNTWAAHPYERLPHPA